MEIVSVTNLVTLLSDSDRDIPSLTQLNEQFLGDLAYENENGEIIVKEVVINAWCLKHSQSGSI